MTHLSISNVVNISVASSNTGINAYNTSNTAIITGEPVTQAVQYIKFSAIAASGAFVLKFGTNSTASIAWNDTVDTIQNDINALTGYGNIVVTGSIASKTLTLTQPGNFGQITIPTVPTNTLADAGSNSITITPSTSSIGWSGSTFGFALYTDPTQVGKDFGTNSTTYKQALGIFSQQPNILAGDGQLIAILRNVTQQTIALSTAPDAGAFTLNYNGHVTTSLSYNSTTAQIQAALQVLTGLSSVQVTGSIASKILTVYFNGVYGDAILLTDPSNTLVTGITAVTITITKTVVGETYGAAITRTQGLVQYFGVMPNETVTILGETDTLAAAAVILPLNLIGFFVSYNVSDIQPGGIIDLIRSGNFQNSRGLYYGDDGTYYGSAAAAIMMASYAGRALSVNFYGSNTTITTHLKQLLGVQPDPTMTQTILNFAQISGADCYVSLQGDPAVFTSGENKFFDQVYNLEWFIGALQVAGYNYLAQSATKVPQTEQGMDGLKGAYRTACNQAVTNQYSAPGTWTSSTTFGNQILFLQNIVQYGYYIYSLPILQQLAAQRQAREAPLVQIAIKEAGAIQKSDVIVYVNA